MIRWVVKPILWLLALVTGLSLIYALPFVHPVSTLMLADWLSGQKVKREWVSFEQMSPSIMDAVLAAEDGRFCEHSGVDWKAVEKAVDDAIEGDRPRGASTVSMQTAKNVFLWPGRSYMRKAIETPLALWLDALWGKPRVIEVYINIAEWGDGIYGVEAASQHYFAKPAKNLTGWQAALLAAALPNPRARNPANPSAYTREYAERIAARAKKSWGHFSCLDK